jgi:hypothetical protein
MEITNLMMGVPMNVPFKMLLYVMVNQVCVFVVCQLTVNLSQSIRKGVMGLLYQSRRHLRVKLSQR